MISFFVLVFSGFLLGFLWHLRPCNYTSNLIVNNKKVAAKDTMMKAVGGTVPLKSPRKPNALAIDTPHPGSNDTGT